MPLDALFQTVTGSSKNMVERLGERFSAPNITAACAAATFCLVTGVTVLGVNGAFTHNQDQYQRIADQVGNLADQVHDAKIEVAKLRDAMPRADQIDALSGAINRQEGRLDAMSDQINRLSNRMTGAETRLDMIDKASSVPLGHR